MKVFDHDPQAFSKVEYLIGGINTYVYNTETLRSYIESFDNSPTNVDDIPINVLYLIHQRGGDHKYTEALAYTILDQYYTKSSKASVEPLICVTFDLRNHGSRMINKARNQDWIKGNDLHALDMFSSIMGNVADLKLIMDFLPSYLDLESLLTGEFKQQNQHWNFRFRNILSGYSLGAHTVFRFVNEYPGLVHIINPVVGCVDLSSLLINRLKQNSLESEDYDKKWFYYTYDELNLTKEEKHKYPEHLHKYLSQQDEEIFENFPMNEIKMYAAFGAEDQLVPKKLSSVWCDSYMNTNDSTEVFIQDGVGHDVTNEMVDKFTSWLVKII
ncbi:hypothetical protein KGF56_002510 [Candida oxycetoniae]|uniref:AB hydrolase-1 domain-containing protein n=1 Tax=Candida oxycetoniae TaxID=497107 RepID=A0AAI9SXR1_9ASCO|nr:uncharacterized protein KGF56_002510 [Candida oxycetoniae]KAI3404676.2 hypothetical protein KGF56_002510 [Candida oxycetoniae]